MKVKVGQFIFNPRFTYTCISSISSILQMYDKKMTSNNKQLLRKIKLNSLRGLCFMLPNYTRCIHLMLRISPRGPILCRPMIQCVCLILRISTRGTTFYIAKLYHVHVHMSNFKDFTNRDYF